MQSPVTPKHIGCNPGLSHATGGLRLQGSNFPHGSYAIPKRQSHKGTCRWPDMGRKPQLQQLAQGYPDIQLPPTAIFQTRLGLD